MKQGSLVLSLTLWLLKKMIVTDDSGPSLEAILKHTLFTTEEELLAQFDAIPGKKGTRILIWNIRRYWEPRCTKRDEWEMVCSALCKAEGEEVITQ